MLRVRKPGNLLWLTEQKIDCLQCGIPPGCFQALLRHEVWRLGRKHTWEREKHVDREISMQIISSTNSFADEKVRGDCWLKPLKPRPRNWSTLMRIPEIEHYVSRGLIHLHLLFPVAMLQFRKPGTSSISNTIENRSLALWNSPWLLSSSSQGAFIHDLRFSSWWWLWFSFLSVRIRREKVHRWQPQPQLLSLAQLNYDKPSRCSWDDVCTLLSFFGYLL